MLIFVLIGNTSRQDTPEEIYDELFDEMDKNGRQIQYVDTFDVHLDREEGDDEGAGKPANTDGGDDEEGKDVCKIHTRRKRQD